jgi:hypothetical protein
MDKGIAADSRPPISPTDAHDANYLLPPWIGVSLCYVFAVRSIRAFVLVKTKAHQLMKTRLLFLALLGFTSFACAQNPTIASFSPTFGPVGTAVTITGANFGPTASNNIVLFGVVRTPVISGSTNSLIVVVPTGATLAPIRVVVGGRIATSFCFFDPTFQGSFNVTFAPETDYSVGSSPRCVVVGDFNGDGIPDVATANAFGGNVTVLFGNGSGGFTGRVDLAAGNTPIWLVVGDFNGDGISDLAACEGTDVASSMVSVWPGSRAGTFSTRQDFSVGYYPNSIVAADFNNDGRMDLATANAYGHTLSVLLGEGTGNFGGRTDLATGVGGSSAGNILGIAAGDFKKDGNLDLLSSSQASSGNVVSIHWGDGSGNFSLETNMPTGALPRDIAVGDFNHDGFLGFATANTDSNSVSVFLGNSNGLSWTRTDYPVGVGPHGIAVGDFNGDGNLDLVTANRIGNTITILLGNGLGGFHRSVELTVSNGSPYSVAVGDFNGDGRPDIVTANAADDTVSVFLNTTVPPVLSYVLSATTAGGGLVVPNPLQTNYPPDTLVSITATPFVGWAFLYWIGDADGTNPVATITMTRNKYVQAVFATQLTTASLISADPQSDFYPFGTRVKLTVIPPAGTYFSSWGGDAVGTNNPLNFFVDNPNPSVSCLLGSLNAGQYALTVLETGQGHVVTSPLANYYTSGQNVTITPVPDAGESFIGWGGDASGTQNPLTVTLNQSMAITANFTKRPTLRVGTPLEGMVENGFRFSVLGVFGGQYQIIGSTNLLDWTPLGMLTNTYGLTQFLDANGINAPLGFYGLRQMGQ